MHEIDHLMFLKPLSNSQTKLNLRKPERYQQATLKHTGYKGKSIWQVELSVEMICWNGWSKQCAYITDKMSVTKVSPFPWLISFFLHNHLRAWLLFGNKMAHYPGSSPHTYSHGWTPLQCLHDAIPDSYSCLTAFALWHQDTGESSSHKSSSKLPRE